MLTNETDIQETVEASMPNWGDNAPRGGMAVMNRILKDKATVPARSRDADAGFELIAAH